jgi:ABC-type Zn uptake system ZnuABC Zn-binding protein ZnuA
MSLRGRGLWAGSIAAVLGWLINGCGQAPDTPAVEIAVTNSYLLAIVQDVCGDETAVFSVVPPGMCPGHFDITPADMRRLHHCRLLLAFDFQESIGTILPDNGRGPHLATLVVPPGMCVPRTYLAMAQQTAEILIAEYPHREATFRKRLEQIAKRMEALEAECAAFIDSRGLRGAAVLTSRHQAVFAQWLGLNSVASFSGGDIETAANINAALSAAQGRDVRCIIANQQEGTRLAHALADRLEAPAAVFSNFPHSPAFTDAVPAFDELVRNNLARLAEALQ